jgi:large subunit ribosomal protein L20
MAIHEPAAFAAIAEKAKGELAYLKNTTPNAFEGAVR